MEKNLSKNKIERGQVIKKEENKLQMREKILEESQRERVRGRGAKVGRGKERHGSKREREGNSVKEGE